MDGVNWQTVILALVAGLTASITPTVAALLAYRTANHTKGAVREVKLSINGRLDQLVESKEKEAHAAGMVEGGSNIRQMEAHASGVAHGVHESDAIDRLIHERIDAEFDRRRHDHPA